MPTVKRAGIFSKPSAPAAETLVPKLIEWLRARGIEVRFDHATALYLGGEDARRGGVRREDVPDGCDMMIVLGGDGTLLSAARAMVGMDIPLFAV
ncbi:MAG TPA: NAD(+)/NADH kinase, partial [Bryobacteraceae bacterium]